MKKKIAIIGAGFFGVAAALILSKKHKVDLYEKKKTILNGASKANQMRFHQGYHYPRSIETLNEVKKFNKSFIKFYGNGILGKTNNYYAVSKHKSKTTYDKFLKFLNKNKLFFKKVKNKNFSNHVSEPILSDEKNLNYFIIKKKILSKLKSSKINLILNKKIQKKDLVNYDKIIIACYDQNNIVLKDLGVKPKKKYKYELVEKIIIKLPKKFKKESFMVLDGKFVSLDPYLGTNYHLLSDVKFSKIEIIEDYFPRFKSSKKKFINKGIVKNIKVSRFNKFINNSKDFLPFLKKAKYIGSFFVVRTIEINKEKTDSRLNQIIKINKKIITILSGKWNTSVGLAQKLNYLV
jgi:D-amino-acid oxidase